MRIKTSSATLLALVLTALAATMAQAALIATPATGSVDHPLIGATDSRVETGLAVRLADLSRLGDTRSLRWDRDDPPPQGALGLEEKPEGARSLRNALLLSAALPGLGERYLGAPRRGMIFMGAEVATWATWGTFKTQEYLRRENYIEMAEVFAGTSGDHDDEYWKVVGQFANWLDYNEWLRFQARREYGFGTSAYYSYIEEKEVAAADAWDWNNLQRRQAYAEKRKASLNAERRATYTLYALLVNRVISLVDTWRLYRTRDEIQDRIEGQRSHWDLRADPDPRGVRWRLGWYRGF